MENRAQNGEIGKIGKMGKILLFFSLLLSKWADNRSIRWVKSKISSWSSYVFILLTKTTCLPKSTFLGSWDFGKKVKKGPKRSNGLKTDFVWRWWVNYEGGG